MKLSLPALEEIEHIFYNENQAIAFLTFKQIFYSQVKCGTCGSMMSPCLSRRTFRCPRKRCHVEITIKTGTFFEKSRLSCGKILSRGYWWLLRVPQRYIETITRCDSKTVHAFHGYFRQLVGDSLSEEDCMVGGDGVIVEVGESKFSKQKYDVGHQVDGAWILGGVERTSEKRIFLKQVSDRSAKTLLDILAQHIRPGSVVMTDLWRGYIGMAEALGVEHVTVNHSIQFKDPKTGACTNTIEGMWNGVKLTITPRQRSKKTIDQYLL
jgi:ISXO2-like transposase domain